MHLPGQVIHATLKQDMPEELVFIQRYDEVKKELQRIVDMPDKDINMMIVFLHQNKGVISERALYNRQTKHPDFDNRIRLSASI